MTLDELERQSRDFYEFLAISGCKTHFKSELRRNQLLIETDMYKLRMKFSALNVDCDGPSLDFYVRQQNVSCVLAII